MNFLLKISIDVVLFACLTASAHGQVRARVSGLDRDSVYLSLLAEEKGLKGREDSLRNAVREARARFAVDTVNLYGRSREILRMEETIFAIRNQLGVVASRINGIEQDFIMRNLFELGAADSSAGSSASPGYVNLIDNDYFKENLSAEEYGELCRAAEARASLRLLAEEYAGAYGELERLVEAYNRTASPAEADSVMSRYRAQLSEIRRVEAEFESLWADHFNQQIYFYSYLLDKLNRMDDLAALNEKSRARQQPDPVGTMSAVLAGYPGQLEMLAEYELALARALDLGAAVDSLTNARRTAENVSLDFPKIGITEREFVRYEKVSFPEENPYNAENPVPELSIPESGTCYSVAVGTFSQRQAVSIFRGAAPLYYQRLPNGQWRYYAGLFRSYGEVQEAVQQLRSAGFRRPEPVRWKDKTYENLAAQSDGNGALYRIEIHGVQGDLPANARDLLSRYARTKEITRVGSTFYVGTFTDPVHLDDVMQALGKIGGLELKTVELEE